MIVSRKIVKALSLCVLVAALAACSGAPKRSNNYTSASGVVTSLDNDRESCARSCNTEFDRCNSTQAAESTVGRGQLTGILGAQADCKDSLKSCLSRCKTR